MISAENFKKLVMRFAKEIGVEPKEIHIRDMTRKWASCSTRGRLTFSTKLLKKPPRIRNEAIIHELLHLKYPNHGRMFKALLKIYLEKSLKKSKK
jgi:predicted metal-dependent hydrolase